MARTALETLICGDLPFETHSDAEILDGIAIEIAGLHAAKDAINEAAASFGDQVARPHGAERKRPAAATEANGGPLSAEGNRSQP